VRSTKRNALTMTVVLLSSLGTTRLAMGKSSAKPGAVAAATSAAHIAAKDDALLEALLTELDRTKEHLKMDKVQPPYYIEYRVNDVDDYSAEAAFGALRESQRQHLRVLRVVVRIGDYKQDSFYNQGMGNASILRMRMRKNFRR
jgi:TldD protein